MKLPTFITNKEHSQAPNAPSESEVQHGRNAFFMALTGGVLAANTEMVASAEAAGLVFVAALGAAAIEGKRAFHANQ